MFEEHNQITDETVTDTTNETATDTVVETQPPLSESSEITDAVDEAQAMVDEGREPYSVFAMVDSAGFDEHITSAETVGDFLDEHNISHEMAIVNVISDGILNDFDTPMDESKTYQVTSKAKTGG